MGPGARFGMKDKDGRMENDSTAFRCFACVSG